MKVQYGKFQESGHILILSLVVLGLVLANTLSVIAGSMLFVQNSTYTLQSAQATSLAEAGIDKALVALNSEAGSYSGEEEVVLENGSFSVSITSQDNGIQLIESTGFVPSKTNHQVKKTIKLAASKGDGASFNYGLQVGSGGLVLGNNSVIANGGSVYSHGDVSLLNNSVIEGDVVVAGGVAPAADQQSSCQDLSCTDFIFGTTVTGQNRYDVVQSFQPSTTNTISKISLTLKKTGTPSDLTVRIVEDKDGLPNKNKILTSGVVAASLVTGSYGQIDVPFSSSPLLTQDTTYWIVLDTTGDASNYWSWQLDNLQSYTRGTAKWTSNWQANNPSWNSISGDLAFQIFLGGAATKIEGSSGASVYGDVRANTIRNMTIGENAYYQIIENSTATNYFPNSPDSPLISNPLSESLITEWKQAAVDAATFNGNISSCPLTLPAGKYNGSVTLSGCTFTAGTPIWITGDLNLVNSNNITLQSTLGSDSGVIIVDGQIEIGNNNVVSGTGQDNSKLILISTYSSPTLSAVDISNGGNQLIVYAADGIVSIGNGNTLEQITAGKLIVGNNVIVNYNSGFASLFFSSGPSGSYSIIRGSYQIQ